MRCSKMSGSFPFFLLSSHIRRPRRCHAHRMLDQDIISREQKWLAKSWGLKRARLGGSAAISVTVGEVVFVFAVIFLVAVVVFSLLRPRLHSRRK